MRSGESIGTILHPLIVFVEGRVRMAFGGVFQGSLFAHDFLADSIAGMPDWAELDDAKLAAIYGQIKDALDHFPTDTNPNETQTEDDLIWRVLQALGWTHYLRQQNLSARGREDVPDGLLFADQAVKDQANANPEEWRRYRYGKALVESKRWDRPLDRRSGRRDEDGTPSTQMLRYLRRADDLTNGSLRWGILTNGARWRLYWAGARSVSEQFFDIDLAAVMNLPNRNDGLFALSDDERAHAFKVFVAVFRREAFLPGTGDLPPFHFRAIEQGKFYEQRVADSLSGVVFQTVFPQLAAAIAEAAPDTGLQEVREASLILLYRLLFILYAEDRDLLPVHDARYDDYGMRDKVRGDVGRRKDEGDTFSTSAARYWSAIDDLCRAIDEGDGSIGLPPYNGGLFKRDNTPLLTQIRLGDQTMADVIDALSFELTPEGRRYINYRDLSVQQLGSIYERLLEHEVIRENAAVVVRLNPFARKGSGSYYTPDDLVGLILRETLEPLVSARRIAFIEAAEAAAHGRGTEDVRRARLSPLDPAEKLLELKICDPAMGSGHFLVSLVDYLADEVIAAMAEVEVAVDWTNYVSPLAERIDRIRTTILANAQAENWTVDQEQLDDRHIVRRMVLKRCVYGVDKNAMAVELAKVSLWLHTFTVGAPLSFLDHHLRCGDSLFGSWVRGGMEKAGEFGSPLLLNGPMRRALGAAASMATIEGLTDAEIAEAHRSADIFDSVQEATDPLDAFLSLTHALDWLNIRDRDDKAALRAFFDGQFGDPIRIAQRLEQPRRDRPEGARFASILERIQTLMSEVPFLNWQVAFPGVWREWESNNLVGGFDAVIGNPPWDLIKLQQVEWFAARRPEIAFVQRAADREKLIEELRVNNDPLFDDFVVASELAESTARIARRGGEYPLLSSGDINIYSLFVERALRLIDDRGMMGFVTPIGIGADKNSAVFFSSIVDAKRLKAFIGFENHRRWLFESVHSEDQPTILVVGGEDYNFDTFKYAVRLREMPADYGEALARMSSDACRRFNPNTGTVPIIRNTASIPVLERIYEGSPILVEHSGGEIIKSWPVKYRTMFHMTNDSRKFRTIDEIENEEHGFSTGRKIFDSPAGRWFPLYEGKMVSLYNHRYAGVRFSATSVSGQGVPVHSTPEQLENPEFNPTPRYWVNEGEVDLDHDYVLAFNDICNTNNRRSLICSLVPRSAYGNKLPILVPDEGFHLRYITLLLGNLASIPCDFSARQKIQSRNLNKYILEQLPVVPVETYDHTLFGEMTASDIVMEAVLELSYTSYDMAPFARDMGYVDDEGEVLPPFFWDEIRRLRLKSKLDAVYFHLYGVTDRDDVRHIYSTFPIVEREETAAHGRYLSRDLCLAYMNALAAGHADAEPDI